MRKMSPAFEVLALYSPHNSVALRMGEHIFLKYKEMMINSTQMSSCDSSKKTHEK